MAVIIVVSCDFPLIFPALETVAIEGLLEDHFTVSFLGFGCQKVDFNLVAGKLHKAETVFVTLGEN